MYGVSLSTKNCTPTKTAGRQLTTRIFTVNRMERCFGMDPSTRRRLLAIGYFSRTKKMTDYWSKDFCGSEPWSSLASGYTIDLLDFLGLLSDDDVGWELWLSDPDEFLDRCEDRGIQLLLDMTGCLDAQ